jgi:hypothetical protein
MNSTIYMTKKNVVYAYIEIFPLFITQRCIPDFFGIYRSRSDGLNSTNIITFAGFILFAVRAISN